MLQNRNDSQNGKCLSFCSSCKSELQSICSIGVPSYLDESISSTSNIIQDLLHMQEFADDELTMLKERDQSYLTSDRSMLEEITKDMCEYVLPNKRTRIISPKISSSLAHTRYEVDDSSNCENNRTEFDKSSVLRNITTHKMQKINYIKYKRMYKFTKFKDDTQSFNNFQHAQQNKQLKSSSTLKSCNLNVNNTQEIKPETSTFNVCNFEKWKKAHNITVPKNNINNQIMNLSKTSIHLEKQNSQDTSIDLIENDLEFRRRNIYNLAVRVSKLSAHIRSICKVLLEKKDIKRSETIFENNDTKHTSFKNKDNITESYINSNTPQDLPMYNYNPLRPNSRRQ